MAGKNPSPADDFSISYDDLPTSGEKRKRTLLLRKAQAAAVDPETGTGSEESNLSSQKGKGRGTKRKANPAVGAASADSSSLVTKKAKVNATTSNAQRGSVPRLVILPDDDAPAISAKAAGKARAEPQDEDDDDDETPGIENEDGLPSDEGEEDEAEADAGPAAAASGRLARTVVLERPVIQRAPVQLAAASSSPFPSVPISTISSAHAAAPAASTSANSDNESLSAWLDQYVSGSLGTLNMSVGPASLGGVQAISSNQHASATTTSAPASLMTATTSASTAQPMADLVQAAAPVGQAAAPVPGVANLVAPAAAAAPVPVLPAAMFLAGNVDRRLDRMLNIDGVDRHLSDSGGPIMAGVIRFPGNHHLPLNASTWPVWTNVILPVAQGGRLTLSDQHQIVARVVRRSYEEIKARMLVKGLVPNAFPDEISLSDMIKQALLDAASTELQNPDIATIHQRLTQDLEYIPSLQALTRARSSLTRKSFKDAAVLELGIYYSIGEIGPDRHDRVQHELHNYLYIFPRLQNTGPARHSQPYRHPAGFAVMQRARVDAAFLLRNVDHWPYTSDPSTGNRRRELTKVVVALTYTAIYAALYQWRSGQYEAVEFASKMFIDCYRGHIGTLEALEANDPNGYHSLMSDLYHAVEIGSFGSASASTAPPPSSFGIAPFTFNTD